MKKIITVMAALGGLMAAVMAAAGTDTAAQSAPTYAFDTNLKSAQKVVHPPYAMAKADKDCSFCHTEKDGKSGA